MIVWARLREREAGTAEVFDSDGNTLSYDSVDTARAALMDAEFVEFDGLDEDDALASRLLAARSLAATSHATMSNCANAWCSTSAARA